MRVLIADDDRVWVRLLYERLRRRGYEVDIAYDGATTKMMAIKHLPDAIILDLKMPGGSGVEALAMLKKSSKTALIPVLVVSGIPGPRAVQALMERGASGFLAKPARPEDVEQALDSMLAGTGAPPNGAGG